MYIQSDNGCGSFVLFWVTQTDVVMVLIICTVTFTIVISLLYKTIPDKESTKDVFEISPFVNILYLKDKSLFSLLTEEGNTLK